MDLGFFEKWLDLTLIVVHFSSFVIYFCDKSCLITCFLILQEAQFSKIFSFDSYIIFFLKNVQFLLLLIVIWSHYGKWSPITIKLCTLTVIVLALDVSDFSDNTSPSRLTHFLLLVDSQTLLFKFIEVLELSLPFSHHEKLLCVYRMVSTFQWVWILWPWHREWVFTVLLQVHVLVLGKSQGWQQAGRVTTYSRPVRWSNRSSMIQSVSRYSTLTTTFHQNGRHWAASLMSGHSMLSILIHGVVVSTLERIRSINSNRRLPNWSQTCRSKSTGWWKVATITTSSSSWGCVLYKVIDLHFCLKF